MGLRGTYIEVSLLMVFMRFTHILLIVVVLVVLPQLTYAHILTSLNLDAIHFISSDYGNTETKTFSFLGLSLKTASDGSAMPSVFNLNIDAKYSPGQPVLNYVNVKEIYFLQSAEQVNIIYGRSLTPWSGLDEAWNLGLFQPQFRWNSLNPSSQGLVGIFLNNSEHRGAQNFSFLIFGSPVFLPDQGPSYELKGGEFQSSNPWFNPPPQNIEFNGQLLRIDYSVNVPKTSDVLFQSVYGAQLGYTFDSGYFIKAAYMSTPSHQIALTYKAVLVADRVKVDIVPVIYRENNCSLDMGYQESRGGIKLNILANQPQMIGHELNYNYPEIKSSVAWGPEAHLNMDYFKLSAGGILVEGGETVDHGPDAGQLSQSLTSKYLFKSAYRLGLGFEHFFSRHLFYGFKTTWTDSTQSVMKTLKIRNSIDLYRTWKFYLDIIMVETSDDVNNVSHLRNLDQAWIGASYEF